MEDLYQFGLSLFKRESEMNNEDTRVSVGLGYTLNLGNFQSLRIDLSVTDSKRDGENTDQAFERVYGFVESRLSDKIKEASAEIESK
jgi:hypothetical protein